MISGTFLHISEAASLGLHAMAILAHNGHEATLISTTTIAGMLDISEAHLSKVMQRLVRAGLLDSKRGPHGGFKVSRSPEKIALLDIYEAIEGSATTNTCLLGGHSCRPAACPLGELKRNVDEMVRARLSSIRLSDFGNAPGGIATLFKS